jgi:hypothetical protein
MIKVPMVDVRIFNPNPLERGYNKAVRTALLTLLLKEVGRFESYVNDID